MISCYPFLLSFIYLTIAFVSGNDLNCTEYPVFTPSRLVVKHGDPANATCVVCQRDCHGNIFDLEKAWGEVIKNGTTLLWTIKKLTEWDMDIQCFYSLDDGDQCISKLDITTYQPPKSVSISFVNHTGPMFEHQQYRLQCSVQDVAPVQNLTVTFYRGSKALGHLQSNSEEKKAVNKIFTLNITASKDDDGALYRCEAKLELGPDGPQPPPVARSQTLTASVYYIDEMPNPVSITITEGDPLHLNCSPVGNPKPTYTWTLPSDRFSSHSDSVLTIDTAGFEDNGQYICTVSNEAGNVTMVFNVDIKANPFMWIIIACSSVALLVIIAFVLYFHYYKQHRKGSYNLKDVFRFPARHIALPLVQQNCDNP
ncbi:hemicentin-1-like [Archocentrus centrarchus]|uniref:hemicentin-1-like n=1 Tax=Archocentrus centrarchus TaxID=63155 RepID=UPI0011EA1858|nr:hemicentin-1-like [Archocentrus centrarchus]